MAEYQQFLTLEIYNQQLFKTSYKIISALVMSQTPQEYSNHHSQDHQQKLMISIKQEKLQHHSSLPKKQSLLFSTENCYSNSTKKQIMQTIDDRQNVTERQKQNNIQHQKDVDEISNFWTRKQEQPKPRKNIKGISMWSPYQNKLFLAFLVFNYDKMDIYPHHMDNRTFNFVQMFIHSKNRNQCQTHWQAVSKSRKRRVFQVIDHYCLKRKDGSYRDIDIWKQQTLQFIKKRLQWARQNERLTGYYVYEDKINQQLILYERNIDKLKIKIQSDRQKQKSEKKTQKLKKDNKQDQQQ